MSIIELSGVGKRFMQTAKRPTLVSTIANLHRSRQQEFWALRDISLTCEAGETVAIIGRNGSGKTTLLRLLTGVSAPTQGRVRVVGRVAPLIGVGVGFNPELTGRENVYVNGQLLGLTREQVDERLEEIIAFSEMADFIETAVKYYSSGMFLRLAFSVAAHTDPDIFVIDEVLAVGDAAFQLKCLNLMRAAQARGATIVIVTHNLAMAHDLAPRAVLLSHGRMVYDGDVDVALGEYQAIMQSEDVEYADDIGARLESGNEQVHLGGANVELEMLNQAGEPARTFATGEKITLRITATFTREISDPTIGLVVFPAGLGGIFSFNTVPENYRADHGPGRPMHATIELTNRLLTRGYALRLSLLQDNGTIVLGQSDRLSFFVTSDVGYRGIVDLDPRIEVDGVPVPIERGARLGE